VNALSPISRALCKEDMPHAGLLEQSAPHVWTIPCNVHSQANHHGHSAFTSLAPSVFRVALSHSRIVGLTDRPVTFPSRTPGSARLRPTHLDVMAFLRRVLPHVLPEGCRKVRHCGLLHASGALPPETLRRLSVPASPREGQPTPWSPPKPRAACWPTCGVPRRVVRRLWTSPRACVDTR
jgi:Putative transposase